MGCLALRLKDGMKIQWELERARMTLVGGCLRPMTLSQFGECRVGVDYKG